MRYHVWRAVMARFKCLEIILIDEDVGCRYSVLLKIGMDLRIRVKNVYGARNNTAVALGVGFSNNTSPFFR